MKSIKEIARSYIYNDYNEVIHAKEIYRNGTSAIYKYTYDDGGNILTERIDGVTHTYTYDDTWKDKLIAYDGKPITYDVFGCPTNYMDTAMTWDIYGGLTSIDNGTTVDGTTDTETLRYYYDSTGKVASVVYKKADGTENGYFYARNAQGDIIAIYRSKDSKLIGTYEYDLWGRPISVTEASEGIDTDGILTKNPFRYRGYYYDNETGFYYVYTRYYDSEICRWISADGYFSTGQGILGNNMFAYCGSNPINRVDPTGEFWNEIWEFAKTAVTEIGKSMGMMSPAYAGCGRAVAVDGPLPFGDIVGLAGGALLTIGAIGYGVYQAAQKQPGSFQKVEEKKEVKVIPEESNGPIFFPD